MAQQPPACLEDEVTLKVEANIEFDGHPDAALQLVDTVFADRVQKPVASALAMVVARAERKPLSTACKPASTAERIYARWANRSATQCCNACKVVSVWLNCTP